MQSSHWFEKSLNIHNVNVDIFCEVELHYDAIKIILRILDLNMTTEYGAKNFSPSSKNIIWI